MSGLNGKVALVTGASSGVGRAIALELARRGAAVLCSDLGREARKAGYDNEADTSTDELIVARGGQALFKAADVSKATDVEAAVAAVTETFGRRDIMVNNAGIFTGLATVADQSEADFDLTLSVNVKGVFLGCKYAIRQMMAQSARSSTTSMPRFILPTRLRQSGSVNSRPSFAPICLARAITSSLSPVT